MTKRFSVLAVSAAIAGGFFIASVPAHAATSAEQGQVSVKASVTCNKNQLRQQIDELRNKAAKLKRLGETAASRKALSDATALESSLICKLVWPPPAGRMSCPVSAGAAASRWLT
jgi:NAD(P)H-dependent flavin oxidoreductase YrpB (nitropropane dioxygenase family)